MAKVVVAALSLAMVISLLSWGFAGRNNLLPVSVVHAEDVPYQFKAIVLNPGSNESELRFTWYSTPDPAGSIVQIAKKSEMSGGNFPADTAMTFTGEALNADAATTAAGWASNKVTATGLQPSTAYVYRVGDGTTWSQAYDFSTQRSDEYTLLFVGDPQIGASKNAEADTAGWNDTLTKAFTAFPNTSFIMSAGDQVETATKETEYDFFLSPDALRNLPVASVVGNHDNNINYQYHFNQPNESKQYGVTKAGGDYFYTYGDTLLMVLNSNNMNAAEHVEFMKETEKNNPKRWKFVTFHHSIYSAGPHSVETGLKNFRAGLVPTFDELDIDMIFMGHDHSYVKTYVMYNDLPQYKQLLDMKGNVVNPTGAMYITANSASGSKYYALQQTPEVYSAERSQLKVPTFSTINVTANSVSVDTYRTDTMEKVDSYSMVKEPEKVKVHAQKEKQTDPSNIEFYYAIGHANQVNALDATFQFDSKKLKFKQAELVSENEGVIEHKVIENDGGDNEVTVSGDTVRIAAGMTAPVMSEEFKDVVKLTFELVGGKADGETTAELKLLQSTLAVSVTHKETISTIEADTATVTVGKEKNIYDLNGDGKVTVADLSIALDFYRSKQGDANWEAAKKADFNGDGVVDLADITTLLLQVLAQK